MTFTLLAEVSLGYTPTSYYFIGNNASHPRLNMTNTLTEPHHTRITFPYVDCPDFTLRYYPLAAQYS